MIPKRKSFPASSLVTSIVQSNALKRNDRVTKRTAQYFLSTLQTHDDVEDQPAITSWQPQRNSEIQKVTQKAIIHELTQQQNKTIQEVVPWFLNNMPSSYFKSVPENFRLDHIKAISAIQDANLDLHMNLETKLPDGRLVLTYIRPGKDAGRLLNLVKHLPWDFNADDYLPLTRAQVFTSEDGGLSISMFVFGEDKEGQIVLASENGGGKILNYAQQLQSGVFLDDPRVPLPSPIFERDNILNYFNQCHENYIVRSDPRRFLRQLCLYEKVSGTECMAVAVEKSAIDDAAGDYWIDIAVANSLPQVALENASMVLSQHNLDIVRSHLDKLSDGENGDVCMLRLLVSPLDNQRILTDEMFEPIIHELKRTKWLDPYTMDLVFKRYPWLGVTRGEILTGLCSILHPIMAKKNQYAFSLNNIFDLITNDRNILHASSISDLLLDRFNPDNALSDEDFEDRKQKLVKVIMDEVEDSVAKELLLMMIHVVKHTLRTNIYLENRYALGLRLDPEAIKTFYDAREENPYGIIFCHGRRFNSFHVRFKDIARGGMRLVTPANPEQFALESARHYDECFSLAYAQQLKNKDIPEGGSKAVNLINCNGLTEQAKQFVMRKSVKAFTNTILDLVVDTDETRERVVDRIGKKEVVYLGPDEQVTVDDINWIVNRAAKRNYSTPNAFMSSKPRAGINHKVYGVTSEGVNCYLDVALRQVLSIDPTREKFTVKMTGGPDGDVAGNEIKILLREYGENATIVGIADGFGSAEDPDGLDHDELLRLVNESLSISEFNPDKFGPEGVLHLVDNEEGIKARNSMHNRLVADAFIPAGGRPSTIDKSNYRNFLLPDGTPSSKLIVEGANLFITDEARQSLYDEAGVVIIKDSSANKCGVITSSYEICASMLLSEDDFFRNKDQIVSEVLEKLRGLAKMEAEVLFNEFEAEPDALPKISQRVSNSINVATDAIANELDYISDAELKKLLPLFRDHLPKTISDIAFDELHDKVPEQYIKNAIASCLASKLVYKEGCSFIDSLKGERLPKVALKYIAKENELTELKAALLSTDMAEDEKDSIMQILENGGVRAALHL